MAAPSSGPAQSGAKAAAVLRGCRGPRAAVSGWLQTRPSAMKGATVGYITIRRSCSSRRTRRRLGLVHSDLRVHVVVAALGNQRLFTELLDAVEDLLESGGTGQALRPRHVVSLRFKGECDPRGAVILQSGNPHHRDAYVKSHLHRDEALPVGPVECAARPRRQQLLSAPVAHLFEGLGLLRVALRHRVELLHQRLSERFCRIDDCRGPLLLYRLGLSVLLAPARRRRFLRALLQPGLASGRALLARRVVFAVGARDGGGA